MISSFLSKLKKKKVIEVSTKVQDIVVNDKCDDINIDISSSVLATKGWPCDALGFCYHPKQCVFVVGTETGILSCMGNNYQYTRTKLYDNSDGNEVAIRKIIPIGDDKVFISNNDNSLALLSVPSLELIDMFNPDWLGKSYGHISYVYVDEPSELNFVYIGTTRGFIIVLDVKDGKIRLCDYMITLEEIGLQSNMGVRSIQLCPLDDKFIAIAYRDRDDADGAIVIFDLVKKKLVRAYSTSAITTLAWTHTGHALYAGTVNGDVLRIDFANLVLSDYSVIWSYKNYYDSIDFPVAIRNMVWLASQDPSSTCLGCLLVSFITDKEDRSDLINCIIGLAEQNGKVETIFELPKSYNEDVLDFCIVPTIDIDGDEGTPVPALCIIFECDNDFDDSYIRVMKVTRCPVGDMNDWPLEIGLSPEPRLPYEILSSNDWVSTILAVSSSPKNTIASLFLKGTTIQYAPKESEKEFSSDLEISIDIEAELLLSWNIALSSGSISNHKSFEDVIILGHDNGEISVWAISNLQGTSSLGVYWRKLQTIKTGKDPITHINIDHEERLLIAGSSLGLIYVFDVYDTVENMGHVDILRRRKRVSLSSPLNIPRAFSEDVFQESYVREFSRIDIGEMITCSLIVSEFTTMFFGTKTGSVLACNDMSEESLIEIERIRDEIVPANEKLQNPVTGLVYGAFWKDNLIPACYVHYKSGHVVVVDVHTFEVIAYHYAPLDDESDVYSKPYSKAFGYLLDNEYNIMSGFDTLEIVKDLHSIGTRSRGSSIASRDSSFVADPFTNPDSLIEQQLPPKPPKPDTENTNPPPKPSKNSLFSVVAAATFAQKSSTPISIPQDAPHYLLLLVGKYLVLHDLSKLAIYNPENNKYSKVDITATSVSSISRQLIINSSKVTVDYNDENIEMLLIQLLDGTCSLLSPSTRKSISNCDLLENFQDKYIVDNATFLKNGNSYLEKNGCFIVSSILKIRGNEIPNYDLPERVNLDIHLPGEKYYLSHGRSNAIEVKKAALQKRRQSMITITSGPTDLTKCFSKSKVSLSISTNVDEELEDEVENDICGYSPRTVRMKSAAIYSSPKLNRSSNYLSKTSMLLLRMNEEMIPEIRRREREITKYHQPKALADERRIKKKQYAQQASSKEMKSSNEKHELIKEAQKYDKYEQNKNQREIENQKILQLETKKLFAERGVRLERSNDKAESTKNAAKEYRDALAEQKKKLAVRASFWGV